MTFCAGFIAVALSVFAGRRFSCFSKRGSQPLSSIMHGSKLNYCTMVNGHGNHGTVHGHESGTMCSMDLMSP